MKKSFPVNISGRIYYFDEDAYDRLNAYYQNLRQAFSGDDGAEIVEDIESRVAEIIAEHHSPDSPGVVTISEVTDIITRMGQPEELAGETTTPNEPKGTTPPPFTGTVEADTPMETRPVKRLYRDMNDKVIAGVVSGLAYYLGVNITALRVAVVVAGLCTWIGPFVLLYLLGWLLIPAAETPRQILQMTGQPVTVDAVGRTTIFGTPDPDARPRTNQFWGTVGRIISVGCMSILGFIGLVISISMVIALIGAIAGVIAYAGWGYVNFIPPTAYPIQTLLLIIVGSLTLIIPSGAAVWAACTVLFKAKGASRRTAITLTIIEIVLVIVLICMIMGFRANDMLDSRYHIVTMR